MIVRRSRWLSPPLSWASARAAKLAQLPSPRDRTTEPRVRETRPFGDTRLAESLPGSVGRAARKKVGMQDLAQDRHAVNDARTMAAEIPSPVDGINACFLDRRQALPLGETGEWLRVVNRSCQVEATG